MTQTGHWPDRNPAAQQSPGRWVAMAAGVTDRLWEMGDLVNMLEAFEAARKRAA
jgi:hypothetical protein